MTEEEALDFIASEKLILEDKMKFPKKDEAIMLNAITKNNPNEKFIIDINRKRAILSRCTFQQRVYTTFPLVRLDIDTKPHRNPDEKLIAGTHIHIYKDGHNITWAYPLNHEFLRQINPEFDTTLFCDTTCHDITFLNFCKFCNILKTPMFQIVRME